MVVKKILPLLKPVDLIVIPSAYSGHLGFLASPQMEPPNTIADVETIPKRIICVK